jgi:hypothetical protein
VEPYAELGLGDADPLFTLGGDGAYRFDDSWDGWGPYVGGGLGLYLLDGNSDLGASALFGIDRVLDSGSRFFVQGRVGFVDAPDLQFTTGWTFRR